MSHSRPARHAPSDPLTGLYGAAATGWQNAISRLGYPAAYAELADVALPCGARRMLDVGTGSGAMVRACAPHLALTTPVDLLDPVPAMLEAAVAQLQDLDNPLTPVEGGIGSRAIPPASYDLVTCAHVIEHTADPAASLRWLLTRLAPGGTLLLAVSKPHWCTTLIRLRWGHKAYRPEAVVRMLSASGASSARSVPFTTGPPSRTSCGYTARVRSR